jgi:Domain of unknown function (DUF4349)
MTPIRKIALCLAGAAAVLTLAGCSSGDTGVESTAGRGKAPAVGDAEVVPVTPGADAAGGAPREAKAADLRVDQRSIVYNGSLTVRVEDVNHAAAKVSGMVTAAGGFVGADRRSSGTGPSSATLDLRVPSEKFMATVDQLSRELGREENRSISTQDVTEETIDLEARIKTQQARVDSGRRLLARARTLSDLVMLESELAKREADLASLEAKKRRLDDLTALSTISLTLLDPESAVPADDQPGFLGGLKAGWTALLASFGVLLTVLGALLPWLIAFSLPVVVAIWLIRRIRRRPATPAPVAPAATTPAD